MEEEKKSIKIKNKPEYCYMMIHNLEEHYVRIVYNIVQKDIISVRRTGIPITKKQKDSFNSHSVYIPRVNEFGLPIGSYIFEKDSPEDYEIVVAWINHRYDDVFKKEEIIKYEQPSIFDFVNDEENQPGR